MPNGNAGHLDLGGLTCPLGMSLYGSDAQQAHVYFPTSAIVSLLYVLDDGASAEIAVVRHEADKLLHNILMTGRN